MVKGSKLGPPNRTAYIFNNWHKALLVLHVHYTERYFFNVIVSFFSLYSNKDALVNYFFIIRKETVSNKLKIKRCIDIKTVLKTHVILFRFRLFTFF